jgi:leucyl-tRNA synthetase
MSDETPYRYTAALADRSRSRGRTVGRTAPSTPQPGRPVGRPGRGRRAYPKLLVLDMFPYPSGAGLHIGHPLGYIATDVFSRYHRMQGRNVLHALGYDAFGLPAEQYAVQTGQHPRKTTEDNIVIMRRQLRRLGLGFDDRRSYATIDEDYYRWTQWIFTQIRESPGTTPRQCAPTARMGRLGPSPSWWRPWSGGAVCARVGGAGWTELSAREQAGVLEHYRPGLSLGGAGQLVPGLGTVLSNEEVTNEGRSERGNFPVFRRNLRQWMMRITAYADRLADDLDRVDWPEKVKIMQRNWIGRPRAPW